MNNIDLRTVSSLELQLLDPAVRSGADALERLSHRDFVEVGASGRRWQRDALIDDLVASPGIGSVGVTDLVAREVASDVVLVTYRATSPIDTATDLV